MGFEDSQPHKRRAGLLGGERLKHLPASLLGAPLPPEQVTYLGEEAERDYQRQKGRYEAELRRIAKQEK